MTNFALKRPVTVFMIAAGLCLLGVISWQQLSVQLLPQFIFPEVFLSTGMAGASPEKIERELVIPIEGEIATLDDIHDIESQVRSNFANIKVSFNHGTNMKFALLKLQQKMSALENRLPEGTRISVDKFDTADLASFLMQMSIRGDASLEDLRDVAEREVRRRLEQIDGVVNVHVGGGDQRTVGIEIDGDRCEAMNIPIGLVQQKINAFHRRPEHLGRAFASGNVMDVILLGQVKDLQELSGLMIEPTSSIRLKDVARVGYVHEQRTQLFRIDGKSSVGIFVQKDNTSNMLKVSKNVLQEIDAINADLKPNGYELVVNFNQAELIQTAITRVEKLAVVGAGLAILVLFLFLRNVRFVTILLVAIPLSLLVTFNFMFAFDLSVNILSLCGLALALGMLVDNGIVVMENVFLHRQRGEEPKRAALMGTKEVGRSIFAATATTILVFLPVLFVESEAKLFVRELALSVIFPLSVSLAVALTVIPLLASRTLEGKPVRSFKSGRVLEIYRLLLKSAIRHRVRTACLVGVLLAITIFIGATFIVRQASAPPPARLDLYVTLPRGTTLEATDTVVRRLEDQILGLTDVKEVRANVRAEEAHISARFLEPSKRTRPLQLSKEKEKIKKQNERLEHVDLAFDRPKSGGVQRRDELSSFLSTEEGMSLKGHDLQSLVLINEQITQTLQTIPEIDRRSVNSNLQGGAPELQIRGDRLQLALAGLSMEQVMQAIWATRTEGSRASTPFAETGGDVDISLHLQGSQERQLDDVRRMRIRNESGHYIPLEQVADVRVDTGPGNIVRHNQERQVKITYSFHPEAEKSKTRLDLAKAQIEFLMQSIRLPRGFTLEKLPPEDQRVYYWMIAIGAILIYMLLAAQFESLSSPVVILGTVPTAIIGALIALTLTGTPLSMGQGAPMALLGLIVLLGIVVNNGIILLDRIAILRNQHGYRWQRAVLAAGQSRVRPIIMTSTTTILGLFPLALKQGTEFELWPPFAITVLGGLAASSFATLVFIPVLYVGLEQTKAWLKRIGWIGISLGTLATLAITYWYYQEYKSLLKTSLLVLPLWFVILSLIYGVRRFFTIRYEKKRLAEQRLNIKIQNLTKIYGSPGRFKREWSKQKRRWTKVVTDGGLPWQREDLKESIIWMVTLGLVLGYLHFFLVNGFWLTVLSCFSLVWFHAARELWYRWGFVRGKPPGGKPKVRRWWFRKKKRIEQSRENGAPKIVPLSPLDFRRQGTWIAVLLFLAYLQFRIEEPALTIVALIFSLLLMRFNQISRKIESGKIDPEQPVGRLRKIKRGIYTVTKAIRFIRPPKQQITALHGVNLEIGKGMFGLLGPNG
ncbi:efflux RND transporter permease subunit, partial [bacterium]|nr:efflux RND transporter permease subunit [bacterium]